MKTRNRLDAATIVAIALALIFVPLAGCSASRTGEPEVSKWNSAKDVEAVVTKAGYGATGPFVYHVFLSSAGNEHAFEILRADKLDTIDIFWKDDGLLLLQVPCGRIFRFQNFYDVLDKSGAPIRRISIVLKNNGICKDSGH